ncbi:MAG TPA: DUF742 domain-containing protein [Acidimicrobiia bacterium]|nr:DUF742 domain-containing protein [Acidimicrobiia bacterium]
MTRDQQPSDARSPRLVRPYVITQGRTRAAGATLALEAAVHARVLPAQFDPKAAPEARRIVELCQHPLSIAEVSARLLLPVGVVRVLVGDLTAAGAVMVGTPATPDAATDITLLERLLDGIRAL